MGRGVWIGGAGRAGALPAGSAALSLLPYVCVVAWWQLQALIWLPPGSLGWFWHSSGGQAGRKEWDGGLRLFFPQHLWSVINWRCWCSCNLALSVGLQQTSSEM